MSRILLVLVVAASTACRGTTQRAQAPASPPPVTPAPTVSAPAPEPLTADECQRLVQHVVQVASKERPSDRQLTADEQQKLDLGKSLEICRDIPRDRYACVLAANATAEMESCDQRTPSSSTSNSSVAPPGIKPPPTPRAP